MKARRLAVTLSFLFAAWVSNRLIAQQTPPSILDFQTRALAAMDENDKKHRYVLYSKHIWAELSGKERCSVICIGDPQPIHWTSNVLKAHSEILDGKSAVVADNWDDGISEKPLFEMSARQRILHGTFADSPDELIRELLGTRRRLRLEGQDSLDGLPVYRVQSVADRSVRKLPRGLSSCAAGMSASVYLDSKSFYPVRVTTDVQSSDVGCDNRETLNYSEGTTWQWDYVLVSGKDTCGELHSIYVPKETVVHAVFGNKDSSGGVFGPRSGPWTMMAHSVARRTFTLDAGFAGGTVTGIARSDGFRIFVTGACPYFDPIEFVESTITFGSGVAK